MTLDETIAQIWLSLGTNFLRNMITNITASLYDATLDFTNRVLRTPTTRKHQATATGGGVVDLFQWIEYLRTPSKPAHCPLPRRKQVPGNPNNNPFSIQ